MARNGLCFRPLYVPPPPASRTSRLLPLLVFVRLLHAFVGICVYLLLIMILVRCDCNPYSLLRACCTQRVLESYLQSGVAMRAGFCWTSSFTVRPCAGVHGESSKHLHPPSSVYVLTQSCSEASCALRRRSGVCAAPEVGLQVRRRVHPPSARIRELPYARLAEAARGFDCFFSSLLFSSFLIFRSVARVHVRSGVCPRLSGSGDLPR